MRLGTVLAERFVVDRPIGTGGMGSVFLAHDRLEGRPVAIKVMAAEVENPRRFRREARLLSELSHPGIVRYIAHGEGGPAQQPFLVMELLEGEDLAVRLKRQGLTVAETFTLLRKVAEALAFAHARGVVHRDIKPSNLFLVGTDPSRVKLLDFGVARPNARSEASTKTGAALGTFGYMAPEQVWGSGAVDARTDVFALGCVLFECLVGRPLSSEARVGGSPERAAWERVPRPSQLRPEVTEAMDELVLRLLCWEPEARPAHAGAVLALLDEMGPVWGGIPSHQLPGISVSDAERRVVSLIVARRQVPCPPTSAGGLPSGAAGGGAPRSSGDPELAQIVELARRYDAQVSCSPEGTLLLVPSGGETAMDQAAQAAACALAFRKAHPAWTVAVASERAELTLERSVPVALRWARAALEEIGAEHPPEQVRLDETTAGLLASRFEVRQQAGAHWLIAERDGIDIPRLLLGKPTRCVGRDAELALLESVLQACIADREPAAVLVTAPPGMGKSRLANEFMTRVRNRDVRCIVARAEAVSAGSSLMLAQKLVRAASGCREAEPRDAQRAKLREYWARKGDAGTSSTPIQGLEDLLGLFAAESSGAGDMSSLPLLRGRVTAAGAPAQKRAFLAWLNAEAAEPLVLVLEDLHWGDQATLTYLGEALRAPAARPWMLLALARPEVRERFPALRDPAGLGRSLHELPLGGLTRHACRRLVRSVLGDDPGAHLLERIVERCDGNAFYLEELIRHVARGEVDLPESVLAMAEARLAQLEPDARRVLRAASVFGEACWSGGVAALLGRTLDTHAWLETLADRELLVRSRESRIPAQAQYAFRHTLLRDAAHAMLPEQDRKEAHRRAGEWLEAVGETNASVLAHHFREAGDRASAAGYELRAGDTATRLCAYGEARSCYEASLESLALLPPTTATRRQEVDALLRLIYTTLVADTAEKNFARAARARSLLDAIAANGEATKDDELRLAHVNYFCGRIHFYRAETDRAIAYYRRALVTGERAGDDQLIGLPSCLIGTALLLQGKATAAEPLLAQAIAPIERLEEPFEWFRVVGYHGLCLVLLGRYAEGMQQLDRILARAAEVNQASLYGASHIMTGTTRLLAGDWQEAHADLLRARSHALETGDKLHLNLAWNGIAWASSFLGQHAEAREARRRAGEVAAAMGGRLMLDDWYQAAEAEIALNAGDVERALELSSQVSAATRHAGLLLSPGIAERVWGDALSRLGREEEAAEHLRRSFSLLHGGGLQIQATRTRLHHALMLKRARQAHAAQDMYAQACAELERFGCGQALAEARRRWQGA